MSSDGASSSERMEKICRDCGDEVPEHSRIYDSNQLRRVHAGVIPKKGEQPRCPDCAPSDQSWRGEA